MVAILELLGRQRQRRVGNASDVLAVAARDHAAGKSVDVEAVDRALHEIAMPPGHFAELCRIATVRRDAIAALEKLGTASTKQRRIDDALEAERRKHDEIRKSYLDRMAALESEKRAADELVAQAHKARETLLEPVNVIGSLRPRYEEALADRQQAIVTVERLRRELREHRHKLKEAERWIESIVKSVDRVILPTDNTNTAATLPPSVVRQLEPHELDKSRAQRRIAEAEPKVREAEDSLDRAERVVATIEVEILQTA